MSSNDSTAKEQSFLFNVNKIFLVIHLLMLFMFSSLGVDLMAGVSLISICFYFLAFSLTKSEKLSIYVYSVAVEILLYMILAVVCLGIQCNFQLFLIDAMFFLFAMDYDIDREYNKKKKNDAERLDAILDKIKISGYDSLSQEEKKESCCHSALLCICYCSDYSLYA